MYNTSKQDLPNTYDIHISWTKAEKEIVELEK